MPSSVAAPLRALPLNSAVDPEDKGNTPLHMAAAAGRAATCAHLVAKFFANPNALNEYGKFGSRTQLRS